MRWAVLVGLHVLVWALVLWATSPEGDCTKSPLRTARSSFCLVVSFTCSPQSLSTPRPIPTGSRPTIPGRRCSPTALETPLERL